MEHEAGTETDGAPVCEVAVDGGGLFGKALVAEEKPAIVTQIMDAHFKTFPGQFIAQFARHAVIAFRDEIEAGAEAVFFFHVRQLAAFGQAGRPSTSWVSTKANCLPSGQPGQSLGGRSEPGRTGQTARNLSRTRRVIQPRTARRTTAEPAA